MFVMHKLFFVFFVCIYSSVDSVAVFVILGVS